MTSAAPTLLAVETNSAWVVIPLVSLVSLLAAVLLRRIINRPGGFMSGLLLVLPLVLPIIAAIVYEHGVLPEIAVMQPVSGNAITESRGLLHLLALADERTRAVTFYALTGSAGPWLMLIGLAVSSFMLLRRAVGAALMRRVIARSRPLDGPLASFLEPKVEQLSAEAGLRSAPKVLILPGGVEGAFAVGVRRPRILISDRLVAELDDVELEAILAHEIAHIQARDVPMLVAAGILRDVVAWNPFAHLALRKLNADRELEADRRAAAMTGEPLAVASGLIKMCELVRSGRLRNRAAVAFFRPGGRLSVRVSHLMALDDGKVTLSSPGYLPYAMAALAVAVLGLQAGAKLAAQEPGALAIMWGAPPAATSEPWSPNRTGFASLHGGPRYHQQQDEQRRTRRMVTRPRPLRFSPPVGTVMLADLDRWLNAMDRWVARKELAAVELRWKARRDWRAVPLFEEPAVGPIGVYRLEAPTYPNSAL